MKAQFFVAKFVTLGVDTLRNHSKSVGTKIRRSVADPCGMEDALHEVFGPKASGLNLEHWGKGNEADGPSPGGPRPNAGVEPASAPASANK